MHKSLTISLVPLSALLLCASMAAAHAQGGPPPGGPGGPGMMGGGPGGPGGGMQMSPEMKKKFDAMAAWNKKNPNFMLLSRTLRGLGGLDRDPATALTQAQARAILPVIMKWQSEPVLTDAQAKAIDMKLTSTLSAAQKAKLAEGGRGGRGGGPGGPGGGPGGGMRGGGPGGPGGMRGGGPGGPGGPGMMGGPGGGGPGGGRRGMGGGPGGPGGFTIPDPKPYNPLNADTLPNERQRARSKERMTKMIADLQAKAK